MLDTLLSFVAPHLCSGCAQIGTLLCDNCKYNIISEPQNVCLACKRPVGASNICHSCNLPYSAAWSVGERKDVLQRLIGNFKFQRAKAGYRVLSDLLVETLPQLPPDTTVIPIPTVASHIRERGYDHTGLIAKHFAKSLGLSFQTVLERKTNTMQRHASASVRKRQAKTAFVATNKILSPETPYLLIDDVATTGATLQYATETLKSMGASKIFVAVVAYQTLD